MKARAYIAGLAAFIALITGGIAAGLYLGQSPTLLEPGQLDFAEGELMWVVVGNSGGDTATARHVREAAARACAQRGGCTGVMLLGESTPPDLNAAEDRALDARIGVWSEVAPTSLVFSRSERADRRRLGAALTWARDTPGVRAASTAWTGLASDVRVLAVDEPGAREAWISGVLRETTGRWRLGLVSHPDDALCGRFGIVFHAATERSLQSACGTLWVGVGTGSEAGPKPVARSGGKALFLDAEPGFCIVQKSGESMRISLFDAAGDADFEATIQPDGSVALPDGTLLLGPE